MLLFFILVAAMVLISASLIKTRSNKAYWRGRGDGWRACEDMVLDRAEKNENYSRQAVWEELIQ
jgi:hypothetical protein